MDRKSIEQDYWFGYPNLHYPLFNTPLNNIVKGENGLRPFLPIKKYDCSNHLFRTFRLHIQVFNNWPSKVSALTLYNISDIVSRDETACHKLHATKQLTERKDWLNERLTNELKDWLTILAFDVEVHTLTKRRTSRAIYTDEKTAWPTNFDFYQ